MDLGADAWWLLLGLVVVLLLWRTLLGLAIFAFAGVALVQIWSRGEHTLGSRLIASALVAGVAVWLVGRVRGSSERNGTAARRVADTGPVYQPPCPYCSGTGQRSCYACHGGGQDFSGDRAKPCGWCFGSGRIRCNCKP